MDPAAIESSPSKSSPAVEAGEQNKQLFAMALLLEEVDDRQSSFVADEDSIGDTVSSRFPPLRLIAALAILIATSPVLAGPSDVCSLIFGGQPEHAARSRIRLEAEADVHIFEGHLRGVEHAARTGEESERIRGGVHTVEAMDHFLRMRPDVLAVVALNERSLVKTLPNGVVVVFLPEQAFTRPQSMTRQLEDGSRVNVGIKSLFPVNWGRTKIMSAIEDVIRTGRETDDPSDGEFGLVGDYQGVRIKVVIRDDRVITAYPHFKQPRFENTPSPRQFRGVRPTQRTTASPLKSVREYLWREGY